MITFSYEQLESDLDHERVEDPHDLLLDVLHFFGRLLPKAPVLFPSYVAEALLKPICAGQDIQCFPRKRRTTAQLRGVKLHRAEQRDLGDLH